MKKASLKKVKGFQEAFTRHIRNPEKYKKPASIPASRMKVYNQLLFNSVEDCLSACFPILKSILKETKWKKLVRAFFEKHQAHSPLYREIPKEFVDYLLKLKKIPTSYPAFLLDLAHYEWKELDLFLAPDQKIKSSLNPIHELLEYDYPVHQINSKNKPKPQKSYYFMFRNSEDEIESLALNAVSTRLIQILKKGRKTQEAALRQIARELKHPRPEEVLENGKRLLKDWKEKGIIK